MAQEFKINSTIIENKINQLLPSQGGFGAGVDFSASTMVIPIVDLTESAEGSNVRQDLQTAFSYNTITSFNVQNATNETIIDGTGYWRVIGTATMNKIDDSTDCELKLFDASASKTFLNWNVAKDARLVREFDVIVYIQAGQALKGTAASTTNAIRGCFRQIADIAGNLV